MIALYITLAIFTWYTIGYQSFVYWWTKDFDFTKTELPLAIYTGFLGPIAFFMGWCLHGEPKSKGRVIKPKRK